MPFIKILPVELRNKIAAGEVIERPASVLKELLENSIDAGSTEIRMEVLRAGKGLIKVTDNGAGMDREDALLCLERHATSKLKSEEDLFNIRTLGFRGEALPSIASVSRMRLITGLRNLPPPSPLDKGGRVEGVGVSIEIEGGEMKEVKDYPSLGTSIEVRDLFFNTPARKKFLKSDSTELYHIIDAVTKEALSHPDVGFILFTGKHETMNIPRAPALRERILQIYGSEFIEGLSEMNTPPLSPLSLRGERGGVKMTAFISKGENFRNSRTHQFIFINGRPVKDQTISHAVYAAYEGILPHDKHPVYFLFLDLDPKKVDFNVHPTKREVRFENKDEIHRFVMGALREKTRTEREEEAAPFVEPPYSPSRLTNPPFTKGGLGGSTEGFGQSLPENYVSESLSFPYQPSLPYIYLGDTFIALAGKGGLTLVDHHAAHERILYENLFRGVELNSHQLLFPKQIKLSHKEYAIILDHKDLLYEMGMEVEDFGHDALIVRSLPEAMREADMRGILSDVAAAFMEGQRPFDLLRKVIAAKIACHSSVRGKEILNQEELRRLLTDLDKTENPDQCPHGRPTRIFLSLDDLMKMFKRK